MTATILSGIIFVAKLLLEIELGIIAVYTVGFLLKKIGVGIGHLIYKLFGLVGLAIKKILSIVFALPISELLKIKEKIEDHKATKLEKKAAKKKAKLENKQLRKENRKMRRTEKIEKAKKWFQELKEKLTNVDKEEDFVQYPKPVNAEKDEVQPLESEEASKEDFTQELESVSSKDDSNSRKINVSIKSVNLNGLYGLSRYEIIQDSIVDGVYGLKKENIRQDDLSIEGLEYSKILRKTIR